MDQNKCISEPKFAKIAYDLLWTNARNRLKFHRVRPNDVREMCYKNFTYL